jgi:hypothetical protein
MTCHGGAGGKLLVAPIRRIFAPSAWREDGDIVISNPHIDSTTRQISLNAFIPPNKERLLLLAIEESPHHLPL